VLIVDDVSDARAFAGLLAWEYDVTTATTASDALERLARGERFDAILADDDGAQLLEELSRRHPDHAARVVLIAPSGQELERSRAVVPVLEKPIQVGLLRRTIARIVGRVSGR
jgi:CheY-like chemotaxis protein